MPYRPPPPDAERCNNYHMDSTGWHSVQCSRRGVVERDGKLYCKQHDPVAVKEKADARSAAWDANWKAQRKEENLRWHKLATWDALLKALKAIYESGSISEAERIASAAIEAAEKEAE